MSQARPPHIRPLILAGGLGTRLRGVIGDRPKPMADIAGRPFLEYLLRQLRRDGFDDVVILTGHGADAIERHFADGAGVGMRIAYSRESSPLGTGGALRLAAHEFAADRYLVMNGDSFLGIDLNDLTSAHREGTPATLALTWTADPGRFGTVAVDPDGYVTGFQEKGPARGPAPINAGVYVLEGVTVASIPADRPVSLEREIFTDLVGRGLRGAVFDAPFIDIGVKESYEWLDAHPELVMGSIRADP